MKAGIMKRTKRFATALAIAIFGGLLVAPAAEATCVQKDSYRTELMRYGSSESSADLYVTKFVRVKRLECGPRGDTFQGVRTGIKKFRNQRIWCKASVFDAIRMNPSPIAGKNPTTRTVDCDPDGMSHYWDFDPNVHLRAGHGDRTITTYFTQVRSGPFGMPDVKRSPVGPTYVP